MRRRRKRKRERRKRRGEGDTLCRALQPSEALGGPAEGQGPSI